MHGILHQIAAVLVGQSGPALHFSLVLFLVFATAKIFGEIFERFGQPGIVGEILAGVVLGPGMLDWVQPDRIMTALAEMGAMFLLFRVGLEVHASELLSVGRTALLVATLGVVLPFFSGWAILAIAGASRTEGIFVGAAMVATSVGITAQVLASRGLLNRRASQVILAAAVIDDILGLLVLAFASSFAGGTINIPGLATTAVLAGGFTFIVAKFGTRAFQRILPKLQRNLSTKEAQFNLGLIFLFGLSWLAAYIGIAAIIGAFLAGLAFSEAADRRVQDLAHGITELLVPFFLATIGLQLRLTDFGRSRTLLLSVFILLAAVLSKLIGCGLGALRFGSSDALRVGVGMIPRGEVGMVVAQIGLRMGIIERPVYAVVVFMTVATTLLAPPLLKLAYRSSHQDAAREEFSLG